MENKITLENKDKLFRLNYNQVFVRLNFESEFKEEVKFKNSAFVKTGRMIPTGNYKATELFVYAGDYMFLSWKSLKDLIISAIDKYINKKILTGFNWKGNVVWLSEQNQQNYASWLTATKLNAEILPLRAKFNDPKTNKEVYYEFTSLKELEDFYSKMIKHINDTVNESRTLKDTFNAEEKEYFEWAKKYLAINS